MLVAAEQIVIHDGFEGLTTRTVAEHAKVNVASVYQYFADRDAIVAALIDRHVHAMDKRLGDDLQLLEIYSVRTLVETVVKAYATGYRAHPSFVVLWFQGRVSAELVTHVRSRIGRLAAQFHSFSAGAGLLPSDADPIVLEVAANAIDGVLDMAFRSEASGDQRVLQAGIEMIVSYIELYATPAGIAGVSRSDLAERWKPPAE
jgi:AcrR family transcriptional regulator